MPVKGNDFDERSPEQEALLQTKHHITSLSRSQENYPFTIIEKTCNGRTNEKLDISKKLLVHLQNCTDNSFSCVNKLECPAIELKRSKGRK